MQESRQAKEKEILLQEWIEGFYDTKLQFDSSSYPRGR